MKKKELLAHILILIILVSFLASCAGKKAETKEPEEQGRVIVLNESDIVISIGENKTITAEPQPAEQSQEQEQEENPEETTDQVPAISDRVSEVEFYFLLTDESFFKATLKEDQEKTYDLSGREITINPIFIGRDEVVFRINGQLTKGLSEKEWEITPLYEIMVSAIYYRP